MAPKVSVIVPVYNVAEYLGQCLDTILLQTLQDIEVICVDDGSTDDSLNILNMYAMFDERLKVIHQENAGAAAARNRGLKEAKGEFISVLDSDDFFHPEMLEKMVAKAEEDNSDVVICGYSRFDNALQKDISECTNSEYAPFSPLRREDFDAELLTFTMGTAWDKLVRSDLIKKCHISFDERVRYCDDICFATWVLGASNKISIIPTAFVHYRVNTTTSQSANKPATIVEDHCKTLSRAYIELKELDQPYNLLSVFSLRMKRSLNWSLLNLKEDLKSKALTTVRSNLHPDIYNALCGNNKTKISLVICAYNGAEFLHECLDSCLNQTLKEIEIICVDDGSTDNTLEILNQYAQKDGRIKVIHQENKGLSISRNNAMKMATGEYIQFVDADDWIEPDTCECLYLYAKIYDLDMLSFSAKEFKNDTKIEFDEPFHCLKWLPEKFIPVFTWQQISGVLPQLAVTSPLTIYRHQYLLDNDISWINKKVAYEDTPFFTESLLKGARMGAFPVQFYHKRVHEDAITQNMNQNFPDYCWICQYTLKKIHQQIGNSAVFIQYLYTFMNKIYLNYEKLDKEVQKKMLTPLYKFCFFVLKHFHMPLSKEIAVLCQEYLQNKTLKKKWGFSVFNLLAKWHQSGYAINPFRFSIKPFYFSIFGKILFFKNNIFIPKIHKKQIAEKDRFILCFDSLNDGLTECIDAYTFFKWCQKNNIPSKYVIHPQNPLAQKLREQRDVILSDKHNFFINCSEVLSKSKCVITSFGLYGYNRYIKKLPWLKYIFIEHGITFLKHWSLKLYTKKDFDYICTPSQPTAKLYAQKGLWKNKQILCGMPRWNKLKRIVHHDKNILIFFTWRMSIQKHLQSHKEYEKRFLNFLNSKKLNTLCKEYNIQLNVALHHAMLVNSGNIHVPDYVKLISATEISKIIGETDLAITDYSSIAFDFMFLDIPTIFYRFDDDIRYPDKRDRLNAKSAKSHDKELYNVFYDEDAVIEKIEFYIKNNFVLEPEYKKINDSLFWEKENICEHLYKKIKEL